MAGPKRGSNVLADIMASQNDMKAAAKRSRMAAPAQKTLAEQLRDYVGHAASLTDVFRLRLVEARRELKELSMALADKGQACLPELEVRLGLVVNGQAGEATRLFPGADFEHSDRRTWVADVTLGQNNNSLAAVHPSFRPGVSGAVIGSMAAALTPRSSSAAEDTRPVELHEIDVLHTAADAGDGGGGFGVGGAEEERQRTTFTVDALGGAIPKERIRKIKGSEPIDLALRCSRYDIRIGCAAEVKLPDLDGDTAAGLYTGALERRYAYREKYRKSFRPRVAVGGGAPRRSAWQVDLTWTQESGLGGSGDSNAHKCEVELELAQSAMTQLLRTASGTPQLDQLVGRLSEELDAIISALNPREEAGLEDLGEASDAITARAREALTGALGRSDRDAREGSFPGTMPINMSRRSLAGLQHYALKDTGDERGMAPYLCAEKTDGVRYLLVVTAQREAVLMDRKMRAFEPPGGVAAVGGCFAPGTVVDGELVLCRMLQGQQVFVVKTFLAFDLLSDGSNEPIMNMVLSDRLSVLETRVLPGAKAALRALQDGVRAALKAGGAGDMPLDLRVKHFYRLRELPGLLDCVRTPRSGVVMECDTLFPRRREILTCPDRQGEAREALRHLTDGVIFAPNTPYYIGTDMDLLKWKFPDTVSIDLKVVEGDSGELFFYTFGDEGDVLLPGLIHLHETDTARLRADTALLKARAPAIAELAADAETGEWVYCCLRPDKGTPNFIGTVLHTLQDVGSGLDAHELVYRLNAPSPLENDWAHHLTKMEKRTVDWKVDVKKKERAKLQEQLG